MTSESFPDRRLADTKYSGNQIQSTGPTLVFISASSAGWYTASPHSVWCPGPDNSGLLIVCTTHTMSRGLEVFLLMLTKSWAPLTLWKETCAGTQRWSPGLRKTSSSRFCNVFQVSSAYNDITQSDSPRAASMWVHSRRSTALMPFREQDYNTCNFFKSLKWR